VFCGGIQEIERMQVRKFEIVLFFFVQLKEDKQELSWVLRLSEEGGLYGHRIRTKLK